MENEKSKEGTKRHFMEQFEIALKKTINLHREACAAECELQRIVGKKFDDLCQSTDVLEGR